MARRQYSGVTEQRKAAKHRLDDARSLFKEKRWRGSMYLAGYSIECMLKAKLMVKHRCQTLEELEDELRSRDLLPERLTIFTHQLSLLLGLTGRDQTLRRDRKLWPVFVLVNGWVPAWRYSRDLGNRDDADDYLAAVVTIVRWVEHNV